MSKWWLLVGVMVVALATPLGGPAQAEKKDAKQPEATEDVKEQIVRDLLTAGGMVNFGREHKAPEALIAAASLLRKVQVQTDGKKMEQIDVPVDDGKGGKITTPPEKEKDFEQQAKDLFDEATTLALELKLPRVEQDALKTLIEAAKARKYVVALDRDPRGGARRISRPLEIGGLHAYHFKFIPNRPAAISLQSSQPVRLVIHQPGAGDLMSIVVTTGNYSWVPTGKGDVAIQVRVQGMSKLANYTLYVR